MIIIGKTAGFCPGITNAINQADKYLEKLENNQKAYCLGDIAHNKEVIKKLENKGLVFIKSINEIDSKEIDHLIIRPHGVTKDVYKLAQSKNLPLIDLTCVKVLHTHKLVSEYANNDYYIFYVGELNHPEALSTTSFCGKYYSLIENDKDIEKGIKDFKKSYKKQALLLSQTTINLENFNTISQKLKKEFEKLNLNLEIQNTICNATRLRQTETLQLSQEVDTMIIIGGKHSSNTKKLYEIAKANSKYAIHIETAQELDIEKISTDHKIGIMAGASTPQSSIQELINKLKINGF